MTGWNVIAEIPINKSGSATGTYTVCTFSSLGVDLTPWAEVRYRFEIDTANSYLSMNNYAGVSLGLSRFPTQTSPSLANGFQMGGISTYNSSFTAEFGCGSTLPLAKIFYMPGYDEPTERLYMPNCESSAYTSVVDTNSLNLILYVTKNGSTSMSYRFKGTAYLEGRK